jgi:hypothetical protein
LAEIIKPLEAHGIEAASRPFSGIPWRVLRRVQEEGSQALCLQPGESLP